MDMLVRIKRLVVSHRVLFTEKAEVEMARDALTPELVYEAILNAPAIFKVLRSRNPKSGKSEKLYVIKGLTYDGLDVYTKGKILKKERIDIFYVLISSKKSTDV
jgi:rRNA pseudouridine-1189 N-methylase Emg1 (Nep1/Mra1 family)